MAEEQIDKLTIAVETLGADNKSIAAVRRQLEKLGRVDLSETIRKLGSLKQALGELGADNKSIAAVRRQLEKLGRVDLSETIRKLGSLKQALGELGAVDESVKSMLDNMTKLGLRASNARVVASGFKEVARAAKDAKTAVNDANKATMSKPVLSIPTVETDWLGKSVVPDWLKDVQPMKSKKEGTPAHVSLGEYERDFKKIGDAAKNAGKQAKDALDQTDNAAKKAQKSTSKLAKTFASMLRFRIAATVIQAVVQSAKEGTTALGEFDAEFKETLNTYSAASKAIGGSIALGLSPALESAVPLVEYIADGIGSIGNSISMITALVKGDDFYQAVKPVSKIREEMAAAEKKAEDLRQLISGFDELNIFSSPKDIETPDIDIFEKVEFRDEAGKLNDALLEDIATLVEFATVAGAAGLVVGFLKDAFLGKNKTLKDQTDLTKDDVKETVKLKDVVNALIPSVDGVTSALGILGGMALPALDPTGITVPAGEAAGALDVLGAKQPAPVVDTAPLLEGIGTMGKQVNEFVTAEYAPINLSASDKQLVEDLRAATEQVTVFAEGLSPVFDTEFGEIKQGWGNLMGGMQDMSKKTTGAIDVTFGTAFDGIESDWAKTMGSMLDLALTAFDNVELMWNSAIADMQAAWDRQFAGGLSVNVNAAATAPTADPATSTEAEKKKTVPIFSAGGSFINVTLPEYESEFDKVVAQNRIKKNAAGVITKAAGGAAAGLSTVGGLGGVMLPNRMYNNLYANGGLVSSGEVFIARENGMPEFVGSFGGQTGVANNEQIVSGIAGGVESVLAAYVPQIIRAIEENATAVNIGDDQIARAAQRGNRRYIQTTGHSMF